MSDDQDEYYTALSRQAGASGALGPTLVHDATQHNLAWSGAAHPHTPDLTIRITAMQMAVQLSKRGDAFPEVIGRARAIYTFLTAGEP